MRFIFYFSIVVFRTTFFTDWAHRPLTSKLLVHSVVEEPRGRKETFWCFSCQFPFFLGCGSWGCSSGPHSLPDESTYSMQPPRTIYFFLAVTVYVGRPVALLVLLLVSRTLMILICAAKSQNVYFYIDT